MVEYEYDFTGGLYRAFIKTGYRDGNNQIESIKGNKYNFRSIKGDLYVFRTNSNIKIDPETLEVPNATLIHESTYGNAWIKWYNNGLIVYGGKRISSDHAPRDPVETLTQGYCYLYIAVDDSENTWAEFNVSNIQETAYFGIPYNSDPNLSCLKICGNMNMQVITPPSRYINLGSLVNYKLKNLSMLLWKQENLSDVENLDNLDLSEVTSCVDMLSQLHNVSNNIIQRLKRWNLSRNINFGGFVCCTAITYDDYLISDVSFIENWNPYFIRDIEGIFACTNITGIPNFNTQYVNSFKEVFYCCRRLTVADLSNYNFSSLKHRIVDSSHPEGHWYGGFEGMFSSCTALIQFNMGHVYTSNDGLNLLGMFSGCTNLATANLGELHDISGKGIQLSGTFRDCRCLKTFSLRYDCSIINLQRMFEFCYALESVDLHPINGFTNCDNFDATFYGCYNLKEVNLNNIRIRVFIRNPQMFDGCTSITTIHCPYSVTSSNGYTINLPKTMYDSNGNSYTTLPGGNITIYSTNPTLQNINNNDNNSNNNILTISKLKRSNININNNNIDDDNNNNISEIVNYDFARGLYRAKLKVTYRDYSNTINYKDSNIFNFRSAKTEIYTFLTDSSVSINTDTLIPYKTEYFDPDNITDNGVSNGLHYIIYDDWLCVITGTQENEDYPSNGYPWWPRYSNNKYINWYLHFYVDANLMSLKYIFANDRGYQEEVVFGKNTTFAPNINCQNAFGSYSGGSNLYQANLRCINNLSKRKIKVSNVYSMFRASHFSIKRPYDGMTEIEKANWNFWLSLDFSDCNSLEGMFNENRPQDQEIDFSSHNISNVEYIDGMFFNGNLDYLDFGPTFDQSKISSISRLFSGEVNYVYLTSFTLHSNLRSMEYFCGTNLHGSAYLLESIDLSVPEIPSTLSSAANCEYASKGCSRLRFLDLTNQKIYASYKERKSVFEGCNNLEILKCPYSSSYVLMPKTMWDMDGNKYGSANYLPGDNIVLYSDPAMVPDWFDFVRTEEPFTIIDEEGNTVDISSSSQVEEFIIEDNKKYKVYNNQWIVANNTNITYPSEYGNVPKWLIKT